MGHRDSLSFFSSIFIVFRFLPRCLLLCFLEVVPVFRHFPPCVYLSVWTCSPGGIVGVEVLSGLIAVWCLVGRRAWLGRRWGKTCPHSLLSLSHPFCLSQPSPFPPRSLTLHMTTQNDGSAAWLINWQRETGRHKRMRKERGDVERAAHRLLKHRLPRCSPRRLPTTSKPSDARRGATRAAKWVRNTDGSGIVAGGRKC